MKKNRKLIVITASKSMISRGLGADSIMNKLEGIAGLKGGGNSEMAAGSYEEGHFEELQVAFNELLDKFEDSNIE